MPGHFYKTRDQIEQKLSDFEVKNNPKYEGYLNQYNAIVASYNETILQNPNLNVLVLFTKAEIDLLEEMRQLCIEYQRENTSALMSTPLNEDSLFEVIADKYREAQETIDNVEKMFGWNLCDKPLRQTDEFYPLIADEELKTADDGATLYCTESLPASTVLGVCSEEFDLENAFSQMSIELPNDGENNDNVEFANIYIPTYYETDQDSDEVLRPSLVGYTTTDIDVDEDPVELRTEISFF